MKNQISKIALDLIMRIVCLSRRYLIKVQVANYNNTYNSKIVYVDQGHGGLTITGKYFSIHESSHLKSNTFIEANGGVEIGRNFHTGRGLTIFSSSHDYKNASKIPYDESVLYNPVHIGDYVWFGCNVTILPGVKIEEGAIVGAGSVVTKNVPKCAVVAGNPAKVIGYRDQAAFDTMKESKCFY
jgi:acetyltransferase-like isoleucine patch superfamily enzyme